MTFHRRSQKQAAQVDDKFAPPVSILKPLCGLDPHAYDTLRVHVCQPYPAFEIIFGVSDPDDPVIPVVQRLTAEFPQIPIKLMTCPLSLGSNVKVSNLIQMLPAARHEFLLINDSDIDAPSDYLRKVIAPFDDTSTGMVTCLYRGVASSSVGSKLESLFISSDFMPGVLCAKRLEGGLHFAMGSTLALSRRTLHAIGGLVPLADYLADDYQMGYRVSKAGLRVELADCVVDHWLPPYTFGEFMRHQLRWARAIRSSRPEGYVALIVTFSVPWSLLTLIVTRGAPWAWISAAAALTLRYAVLLATQSRVFGRGGLRDWWLLPVRDFIALLVWISCYAGRRIVWRGKEFELVNGKLRR